MGSGGAILPSKIRWFVYMSHSLSTWGDRMWTFGVGLFMVIISPESLRLTAIYGLSCGGAVLLLGALVGDWIDRTPRLTAARTALVIQNLSVIVCAAIIFVVITLKLEIAAAWPGEGLLQLCYAVIITIAIVANLASMGMTIAVQRDWIVEICGGNNDMLASMGASLRRIDLITKIVAPIVTGQIMAYGSVGIGALFIGGWNLVSVFVEYYLLWKVYDIVPALRDKKYKCRIDKDSSQKGEEETAMKADDNSVVEGHQNDVKATEMTDMTHSDKHTDTAMEDSEEDKMIPHETSDSVDSPGANTANDENQMNPNEGDSAGTESEAGCCCSCLRRMFSTVFVLGRGWKTYMKYNVAFAGLGLAALYMTVLGFDNITVGYAYSQGVNESIMGVLMGAGALTGILGTIIYPVIRRRIGLERTGLFGFFFEIALLCLCVASIWAPGSPFDPYYWSRDNSGPELPVCITMDTNTSLATSIVMTNNNTVLNDINNVTGGQGYVIHSNSSSPATTLVTIATGIANNSLVGNMTSDKDVTVDCVVKGTVSSYMSVGLLMAGIILARCGLWLSDLTITQLFLENVHETERGIVNGVQTSLNMLMDMLKFIMVIIAPQPAVFGYLILISFAFIVLGWALYSRYSYSTRGHILPFDKVRKECYNNNSMRDLEIHVAAPTTTVTTSEK